MRGLTICACPDHVAGDYCLKLSLLIHLTEELHIVDSREISERLQLSESDDFLTKVFDSDERMTKKYGAAVGWKRKSSAVEQEIWRTLSPLFTPRLKQKMMEVARNLTHGRLVMHENS